MSSRTNMTPREDREQATLFSWAQMKSRAFPELELMYHIPNGGFRTKTEAARFRCEGVKAGVPDVCLPVARGGFHGLYIELKRREGGKVSENQSKWIANLKQQNYEAVVCKGWEAAADAIIKYLSNEKQITD